MRLKNKWICLSLTVVLLVIVVCSIIIVKRNESNFSRVDLFSGTVVQTKEYKLYEFGIEDNDICKNMDNIVEEIRNEYSELIDFEYIDVTKNMTLSNIYSIESVPTFLIVDLQGNVKYRKTGSMTKEELIDFINKINIE
ncbi:MAG: thioredoxin family protein [Clostridia bacterium]|nr:thioredoxin family protein [Clostridia bacterium]